jgi:hypothetical protein
MDFELCDQAGVFSLQSCERVLVIHRNKAE